MFTHTIDKSKALEILSAYNKDNSGSSYGTHLLDDNGNEFTIAWKETFVDIIDNTILNDTYKGYKGGTSFNSVDGQNFTLSFNENTDLTLSRLGIKLVSKQRF